MKLIKLMFLVIFVKVCESFHNYDPCCSLPCQNNGICYSKGFDNMICDCTGTGFYGENCEKPFTSTWIKLSLKPSRDTLQYYMKNFKVVWQTVNYITWLRKLLMRVVLKIRTGFVSDPSPYIGLDDYTSWDTSTNRTVYARTLPPIPKNCPTPMGVKGKKKLPDPWLIAERFLMRKEFRPCSRRTNVIFPLFAQHFTHQFFKTNTMKGLPFQWGQHNVDLSHVYGETLDRQHALRSHVDGKMKMSTINNETFPPLAENVSGATGFGSHVLNSKYRFIFGHSGFTAIPSFLLFSTIWLREHNRICDVLKEEHPEWNDERLFQTARLILTGETIKIVIEDYVQHLSGFHYKLIYDPEIMFGQNLPYSNQIHSEFQSLYHWHALVPDLLSLDEKVYEIKDLLFNPKPMVRYGLEGVIRDLNSQFAGRVSGRGNQGSSTLAVAVQAIKDGRKLRFYPFNKYRIRFGLKPYSSFEEFTGDTETAAELRELYGDIDALELFVGFMLEHRKAKQIFGEAIVEMGSPYSLKGLYGNPISSPAWWKPVTFGGDRGFNIIKTTTLQSLICRNIKNCPAISFQVPEEVRYTALTKSKSNKIDDTASILMTITRDYEIMKSYNSSRSSWVPNKPFSLSHLAKDNACEKESLQSLNESSQKIKHKEDL